MSIKGVAKNVSDIVLETHIVPKKDVQVKNDFFPETSPIKDAAKDKISQAEKDKKAQEIADYVGRIIDYFG